MIMFSVRRHLQQSKTPAQRYDISRVRLIRPEIGSHGDVTSPLRYSRGLLKKLCKWQDDWLHQYRDNTRIVVNNTQGKVGNIIIDVTWIINEAHAAE